MHSRVITSTPIALFLGAGASQPLGKPLMGAFVERLGERLGLKDVELFSKIVAQGEDLEHLLEELGSWADKSYFTSELYRSPFGQGPTIPTLIDREGAEFLRGLSSLIAEAARLQEIVKLEVFKTYRDIKNPEAAVRLYDPLFDALFAKMGSGPQPLTIFTTNYDPAIETFWQQSSDRYDLFDGFENERVSASYVWHRRSFDDFQLKPNKRNLVLFKLHGSADWMQTREGIRKAPPVFAEDETHRNVLIYPAKNKVAQEDPFFTAYDYFQKTLESCKLLIVIGYSFRDYDALTKLKSAALSNPSLRVLVVDIAAKHLADELFAKGIPAEPVEGRFGFDQSGPGVLGQLQTKLLEFT